MARRTILPSLIFAFMAALLGVAAACAQNIAPDLYSGMRWRMIGPFRGGRCLTASGVRGQRDVYYFGSVGG